MEDRFSPHQARLIDLWQRMVRTVGIHTVNVLVERAIWEASHDHPELALIRHDDECFDFAALQEACAGRPEPEVAEAFDDLLSELLLILARLLGKEMGQRRRALMQEIPQRKSRGELQFLAIREILRATASAPPLDEILAVIANVAIVVFDATSAWFMLAEDGALRTVVARGELAAGLAGRACAIAGGDAGLALPGACGRAALAREATVLQPEEVDAGDPVLATLAGAGQAVVLLPFGQAGRVLGLLGAAVMREASPDVSFLATLAGQAAAAIESARLRAETRAWRRRLDAVFERMAEAVLVFDDSRLALMNASAQELLSELGVQPGDTVADVMRKAAPCDAYARPLPLERTAVTRAMQGERVDNLEEDLRLAEGTVRHLLASAVPLDAGDHSVVAVWRDITYIKELERMRAEFLSMVSHELRSPLTSILGFAQLLQRQAKESAPKDLDRRLDIIAEQARRLNLLVEDLLDVSRAESRRLSLKLQVVDLPGLVAGVASVSAPLAADHHFAVEAPSSMPQVLADPGRIEQVLRNLLSNAAKFSPPGSRVRVRLEAVDGRVVTSVADEGVGISRDGIATLFVPFQRLRRPDEEGIRGIGLGLYISRSIIEAHGGEMWVHSQPGRGSTFYFSLPVAPPLPPTP